MTVREYLVNLEEDTPVRIDIFAADPGDDNFHSYTLQDYQSVNHIPLICQDMEVCEESVKFARYFIFSDDGGHDIYLDGLYMKAICYEDSRLIVDRLCVCDNNGILDEIRKNHPGEEILSMEERFERDYLNKKSINEEE